MNRKQSRADRKRNKGATAPPVLPDLLALAILLGFEIGRSVLHACRQRFPDNPAASHLGQWQIFENENPDTFSGMYQFWIQKPG
jgi:hypothetical protein